MEFCCGLRRSSLVVKLYQDIIVNIIKMLCSSSDHYLLLGNGHQIGLELIQIKIESSIKSQRGRDGGHNLTNQPVEVEVSMLGLQQKNNL